MTYERTSGLSRCPHCGQDMPKIRRGVRLTPLKAAIFDALDRARPEGLGVESLHSMVYADNPDPPARTSIKAHVKQINDAFAGTGVRISSKFDYGRYRLMVPSQPVRGVS